jgi:hypothetical protein
MLVLAEGVGGVEGQAAHVGPWGDQWVYVQEVDDRARWEGLGPHIVDEDGEDVEGALGAALLLVPILLAALS